MRFRRADECYVMEARVEDNPRERTEVYILVL